MSLISRLGRRFREKPKSANLDLPSLPTPREILEDIEGCPNTDPVIIFANLIQKKGKPSLLDREFLEVPSASESPLEFLSAFPIASGADDGYKKEPSQPGTGTTPQPFKRKGSVTSSTQIGTSATAITDMEQIDTYNKFKQFLLLYERSEELFENIEPRFRQIEEILESCESLSSEINTDKEINAVIDNDIMDNLYIDNRDLENDVCASPLM